MTINRELMLKIARFLRKRPANFDMATVAETDECGTVACLAGWAIIFSKKRTPARLSEEITLLFTEDMPESASGYEHWLPLAADALGLTISQAEDLFNVNNWPVDYLYRYNKRAENDQDRAEIAAQLLEEIANGKDPWS